MIAINEAINEMVANTVNTTDDILKTVKPDEEYIKDGHIYCKKCDTRRTYYAELLHKKVRIMCKCMSEEKEQEKQRELQRAKQIRIERMRMSSLLGTKYHDVRFETTDTSDPQYKAIYDRCKKYCEVADEVLRRGIGIYLFGTKGVGKTHLTACMANALINDYHTVLYTNFSEISKQIRSTFNKKSETEADFMDKLASIDFLFIDDFGTETVVRNDADIWLQEKVFEVINKRYNNNKPIIFTSNYSLRELIEERGMADKTVDRINEMCAIMKLEGTSYRRKIKEQMELPF